MPRARTWSGGSFRSRAIISDSMATFNEWKYSSSPPALSLMTWIASSGALRMVSEISRTRREASCTAVAGRL